MNIAIYSDRAGVGKSSLAEALSATEKLSLVRLDPQDGGSLANANGVDNSVLDCAPYLEYAEAAVKVSNKMIYIFSSNKHCLEVNHLMRVADNFKHLKLINPNLEIEIRLSTFDKWPDKRIDAIRSFLNINFVTSNF